AGRGVAEGGTAVVTAECIDLGLDNLADRVPIRGRQVGLLRLRAGGKKNKAKQGEKPEDHAGELTPLAGGAQNDDFLGGLTTWRGPCIGRTSSLRRPLPRP